MAVRIRLSRYGRIHRPYFRIVAIDGRCHREGTANEIIGHYDPSLPDGKAIEIDLGRVEAWAKEGASVSKAVINLLKFHGHKVPAIALPKARVNNDGPAKKKDGKVWVKASRRAVRKHAASIKAARKITNAEAKAKHDAAKAAKAADAAPAQA